MTDTKPSTSGPTIPWAGSEIYTISPVPQGWNQCPQCNGAGSFLQWDMYGNCTGAMPCLACNGSGRAVR
jgi:hypothetical protein